MAAELFHNPTRRAWDANGAIASGSKLYFYLTGTTTPRTVYAESTLTTPLTNPVVADSAGVWPSIYLDDAYTYRVVEKDADDDTIADIDPYLPSITEQLTEELSDIAASVAADAAAIEGLATYPHPYRYQIGAAVIDYPAGIPADEYLFAVGPVASRITDIDINITGTSATLAILADGAAIWGPQAVTGDVTLTGQDIGIADTVDLSLMVTDPVSLTKIILAVNGVSQ